MTTFTMKPEQAVLTVSKSGLGCFRIIHERTGDAF